MPRFDDGVVNSKLEKGDIILMGNPTQYGEILAENFLVEDITRANLQTLISASELVRGKCYRVTNAVGSTLSLIVQALTANTITDVAYNTINGDLYTYNITADTATQGIVSDVVDFDPQTAPAYLRGRVWYDSDTESLSYYDDISGTSNQIGKEEHVRVRNTTGVTIANGSVVYVSGATGQTPQITLAQANADGTSNVIGIATHQIANNAFGKVTTFGVVNDVNTLAFAEGSILYLSQSVAGGLTSTRPSAPNFAVIVGICLHSHATQGKILVNTNKQGLGFGTANQLLGINAGATGQEYKTLNGTSNQVTVTHSVNGITLSLPQSIATTSTPQFDSLGLGVAPNTRTLDGVSSAGKFLIEGTNFNTSSPMFVRNGLDIGSPSVVLGKSRSATVGGNSAVVNDDRLGTLVYSGTDGVGLITSAYIRSNVSGTVATNSVPSRISFATTAAGATTPTEYMILRETGQLLLGTTSLIGVAGSSRLLTLSGTTTATTGVFNSRYSNDVSGSTFYFAKSRGASVGSNTIVQSGDSLGLLGWSGNDGVNFTNLASSAINAIVSGTPSVGIIQSELTFSNQNASGVLTEVMRLTSGQSVLIGTTSNPSSRKLLVSGTAEITGALTLATALGVASGGLGITTTPSNGFVPIGNGTNYVSAALTGTANQVVVTNGAGSITLSLPQSINTTATPLFGRLALGGNSLISNRRITIEGSITGSTTAYGMDIFSTIQSDVTSTAFGYRSNLGTQPTAFTLSELIHFNVSSQGLGAGSSVTTQIGYRVQNNMIGATNTYGFQGLLASAANTWNLYMSGTAANHLQGTTLFGTTTDNGVDKVQISGSLSSSMGTTLYTAVNTGQFANITAGGLSAANLAIGIGGTSIGAILQGRTSTASSRLHLNPYGGNVLIGKGSIADSGELLQVQGTANITGNSTIGGTLGVTGAVTGSSTAQFTGLGLGSTNIINLQGLGNNVKRYVASGTDFDTTHTVTARYSNDASGAVFALVKSRAGSIGTNTIVQSGDSLGNIDWFGADGANYYRGARISALVDGTPGIADMPSALVFYTSPDGSASVTEAMRITSSQNILIGTTTPISSAKVVITSTTQGFLPPRMTTTERNNIASPVAGLMIYNTTTNKLNVYTTAWEQVTSA